jgi:hypothetical protein
MGPSATDGGSLVPFLNGARGRHAIARSTPRLVEDEASAIDLHKHKTEKDQKMRKETRKMKE